MPAPEPLSKAGFPTEAFVEEVFAEEAFPEMLDAVDDDEELLAPSPAPPEPPTAATAISSAESSAPDAGPAKLAEPASPTVFTPTGASGAAVCVGEFTTAASTPRSFFAFSGRFAPLAAFAAASAFENTDDLADAAPDGKFVTGASGGIIAFD
jgi:hypothetical protein